MFTILFLPVLLVLGLFYIDIENIFFRLAVFLFSTLACYVYWAQFARLYIGVKYEILLYIFIILKFPTGKIRRNMNSLSYLFNTNYFNKFLFSLLAFAGLAALTGGVKPRGFGGGSFGGGGAGGRW